MTSRLVGNALPKVIKRQLSAQPAAAVSSAASSDTNISSLSNGVSVVTANSSTPVATFGVVFKAGSRYENYNEAGVTNVLRVAAGLSSKNFSSFGITCNIQQSGSNLQCLGNRETIIYAVHALPERVDEIVDFVLDAGANQAFKPWELSDLTEKIRFSVSSVDPQTRAIEALHEAAFRKLGLGNSLFSPDYMVGNHKPALLQGYVNRNFTNSRAAFVGIGLPHNKAEEYAGLLNLESGDAAIEKSKFVGGEIRVHSGGKKAYVYIAAEASGASNFKEAISAMLLEKILGKQVHVKYGIGASKLAKAVADPDVKTEAFTFPYSDTCLVGVAVEATADKAGKAVETVAANLRNLSVSAEEVNAAKKIMAVKVYDDLSNSQMNMHNLGFQALYMKGELRDASKIVEVVNSVSASDVQAVAKKISSGKWALGATGNLGNVPYLADL